ncbi:MAG: DUF2147 domain-containing protein [Spirochaetes bacterium]|nr:DUF2147 domain-containing protein [Spirochaetota bacterium]
MKRFLMIAFAMALAVPAFADPAEGLWKSFDEETGKVNAYWKVWVQDGLLRGTIVKLPEKPDTEKFKEFIAKNQKEYNKSPSAPITANSPIVGTIWMFGLKPTKTPGLWQDGIVIHSGKGKVYSAMCTYKPKNGVDYLDFRGYMGIKALGATSVWERVPDSEIATLGLKK